MDDAPRRAEDLLTLSSAGRRLSDLVAASDSPVRYEVLRHLLRVSEETMTEVLEECVRVRLVRRGEDAFTYVPFDDVTANAIRGGIDEDRRARMERQIASARERVFE